MGGLSTHEKFLRLNKFKIGCFYIDPWRERLDDLFFFRNLFKSKFIQFYIN